MRCGQRSKATMTLTATAAAAAKAADRIRFSLIAAGCDCGAAGLRSDPGPEAAGATRGGPCFEAGSASGWLPIRVPFARRDPKG